MSENATSKQKTVSLPLSTKFALEKMLHKFMVEHGKNPIEIMEALIWITQDSWLVCSEKDFEEAVQIIKRMREKRNKQH